MKSWLLKIKWGANSMVALYLSVISGLVLALKFDQSEPYFLRRPDGSQHRLIEIHPDVFISTSGSGDQVRPIGADWILYRKSGEQEVYDSAGQLTKLIDVGGH